MGIVINDINGKRFFLQNIQKVLIDVYDKCINKTSEITFFIALFFSFQMTRNTCKYVDNVKVTC